MKIDLIGIYWVRLIALGFAILVASEFSGIPGIQRMVVGQDDQSATQADFDETINQWKETCKKLRQLGFEYGIAAEDETEKLIEQRKQLFEIGDRLYLKAIDQAAAVYRVQPTEDLRYFLLLVRDRMLEAGYFEKTLNVGLSLLEGGTGDQQMTDLANITSLIQVATFCNEYATAAELARKLKTISGTLPSAFDSLLDHEEELTADWEAEQTIRLAEEQAANLPRVELETDKGKVSIELFANQAPNSVNHFLDMVQNSIYDGNSFYEVTQQGMAISGSPMDDGKMAPDLIVECEARLPGSRKNYRGSVMLLSTQDRKYSGSVFAISRVAAPGMDETHTVIGRVISGMSTVDQLNNSVTINTEGQREQVKDFVPNKIISAKIIRSPAAPIEVKRVDPNVKEVSQPETDLENSESSSNSNTPEGDGK